jgi:hypothetical protein
MQWINVSRRCTLRRKRTTKLPATPQTGSERDTPTRSCSMSCGRRARPWAGYSRRTPTTSMPRVALSRTGDRGLRIRLTSIGSAHGASHSLLRASQRIPAQRSRDSESSTEDSASTLCAMRSASSVIDQASSSTKRSHADRMEVCQAPRRCGIVVGRGAPRCGLPPLPRQRHVSVRSAFEKEYFSKTFMCAD